MGCSSYCFFNDNIGIAFLDVEDFAQIVIPCFWLSMILAQNVHPIPGVFLNHSISAYYTTTWIHNTHLLMKSLCNDPATVREVSSCHHNVDILSNEYDRMMMTSSIRKNHHSNQVIFTRDSHRGSNITELWIGVQCQWD